MVDEPRLVMLAGVESVYAMAQNAIRSGRSLEDVARGITSAESVGYNEVYEGRSNWKLLAPFDHPDPGRCLVSGTGLTHKASVLNRNAMHAKADALTDSMKMFHLGLEGGRPASGEIGAAPEWFYKGTGFTMQPHGAALEWPCYADDGGEEPEIAGAYLVAEDGAPCRVGLMQGNEFSDHKFEKRNYLYLSASKLRHCSAGPELVVGADFETVAGRVAVERKGELLWWKNIASGESNMCHSLANIEHHHFKYAQHRRPGDAHVHYFGADAFSFGDGLTLEDGDVMEVSFEGFGRALRNPLRIDRSEHRALPVRVL